MEAPYEIFVFDWPSGFLRRCLKSVDDRHTYDRWTPTFPISSPMNFRLRWAKNISNSKNMHFKALGLIWFDSWKTLKHFISQDMLFFCESFWFCNELYLPSEFLLCIISWNGITLSSDQLPKSVGATLLQLTSGLIPQMDLETWPHPTTELIFLIPLYLLQSYVCVSVFSQALPTIIQSYLEWQTVSVYVLL